MTDLHALIVIDAETGAMRVGTLGEMPVDSDEAVWDPDNDEWRPATEDEVRTAVRSERVLDALLANLGDITDSLIVSIEDLAYRHDETPGYYEPEDLAAMRGKNQRLNALLDILTEA